MALFYLEFTGIIVLWLISYFAKNIKIDKIFQFLIIASLLLFSCVRSYETGADTKMYVNFFHLIKKESWSNLWKYGFDTLEKGYVIFNKLVATIYDSARFFIIVTSFCTILPTCLFIEKKSTNRYLSYLLYIAMEFWFNQMYVIRQSIAVSFCLIALIFAEKKGFKNFLLFSLFVLIASTFHQTAIIFFLAYFLRFIKIDYKFLFFGTVVFLVFLVGGKSIVSFINQFARIQYEVKFTGGLTILLCLLAMGVFIYIAYNGRFNDDPSRKMLFLMVVCAIILQVLSLNMEVLIRLARYFMMAIFVIFPNAYKRFVERDGSISIKIVANAIVIVLLLVLMLAWTGRPYVTGYYFMD